MVHKLLTVSCRIRVKTIVLYIKWYIFFITAQMIATFLELISAGMCNCCKLSDTLGLPGKKIGKIDRHSQHKFE